MPGAKTYRLSRPIPEESPVGVHPQELFKGRAHLDVLQQHQIELCRRFLAASGGDLYEIDLVLRGVMVRSYGILDGFIRTPETSGSSRTRASGVPVDVSDDDGG
jgi:hypothetical protein